jgi:DNA-binding IclR family transcriptional regulator
LKAFEIGSAYLKRIDIVQAAKPYLEALAKLVDDTVFMVVENEGQVVYLYKIIGSSTIVRTCDLGSRNHMYCTGVGKALLAAYSGDRVARIVKRHPMRRLLKNTLTNLGDLLEELRKTRERGYALDDRENREDTFCVAAPLYSVGKEPIAAISVATFYFKVDGRYFDLLTREVPKTALEISRKMGFRRERLYE